MCQLVPWMLLLLLASSLAGAAPAPAALGAGAPPGLVSVFVTYADGAVEGLPLALGILEAGVGRVRVIAGISGSEASPASEQLRAAGAVLRPMSPQPDFQGVDCVFLLPPNTEDRLAVGKTLIDLAVAARLPQALLLSVMYANLWSQEHPEVKKYADLEEYFSARWPAAAAPGYVLRTWFYQQNLLLWAHDVQATSKLRMPVGRKIFPGCFAPLYNKDVSRVIAALAVGARAAPKDAPQDPATANIVVLNLQGPRVLSGLELVQAAADTIGEAALRFSDVPEGAAFHLLQEAGMGLTTSEVNLLLGLLALQTPRCTVYDDVRRITGDDATDVTVFFRENANAFRPGAAPTEHVLLA